MPSVEVAGHDRRLHEAARAAADVEHWAVRLARGPRHRRVGAGEEPFDLEPGSMLPVSSAPTQIQHARGVAEGVVIRLVRPAAEGRARAVRGHRGNG